jgi:hypothetical protein
LDGGFGAQYVSVIVQMNGIERPTKDGASPVIKRLLPASQTTLRSGVTERNM